MSEHQASRTLLKSPPELWAECSDAQSLARHLDDFFGEIRITRLEPEQAVAWEGERVSGTVKLEPSGWGTKVTLTATASGRPTPEPATPEPEPVAREPEPVAPEAPTARSESALEPAAKPGRMGFLGRVRYLLSTPVAPAPKPPASVVPEPTVRPVPETYAAKPALPEPPVAPEPAAALSAALESLGKAHHRPFSRA